MRVLVRYAPPFRRWHLRLGARLENNGHAVRFEAGRACGGRVLLAAERTLYRIVADADAVEASPCPQENVVDDLVVDLCGASPGALPTLVFDANGVPGEPGLRAAARTGAAPLVRVQVVTAGARRFLAAGRPAIEDPRVAARALETLLPRLVILLVKAVSAFAGGPLELSMPIAGENHLRPPPPARFFLRGLRAKLLARTGAARGRPEHWRIGVRRVGCAAAGFLPESAGRFRADPFLFEEAGRLWLFAEDFPYASGRGFITCQRIAPNDPATPAAEGKPIVVLEEPFHLSYPLVLRHDGVVYMLPESAAASRLVLYRADPFPTRWVAARQLLAGCFADATPVRHGGRWWMFAAATGDGGSSWDQLYLFHALDLLGPWHAHANNPVLIDAGSARPAGHMWHEDGALMRPVQDCRRGYGGGVLVCRVDRLDEGGYRQTVVRCVPPPPGTTGLHTINRVGGWEAFDVKVPHPTP